MAKEDLLKKAYSQAVSNAAIRFFDRDVDFMVIKTDMAAYLESHDADVSDEELNEYIKNEMNKLNAAMVDFTYNTRMMK